MLYEILAVGAAIYSLIISIILFNHMRYVNKIIELQSQANNIQSKINNGHAEISKNIIKLLQGET